MKENELPEISFLDEGSPSPSRVELLKQLSNLLQKIDASPWVAEHIKHNLRPLSTRVKEEESCDG